MLNYLYELAMYYWDIELLNSIHDRDIIEIKDLRKITPENVCHKCKIKKEIKLYLSKPRYNKFKD
jgi:hypothetical protein